MKTIHTNSLQLAAFACLKQIDPVQKCVMVALLSAQWQARELWIDDSEPAQKMPVPGRPNKPDLVPPAKVPKRSFDSEIGRVKLAHAIAHIEFNAINLALDAVYRFRNMPDQFYTDWLQVAGEEAKHFSLLNQYLINHGSYYGEYTAHNGLWEMAVKTDHDVMVRMALVPRVLEARGLDVTPGMIKRLQKSDDKELISILNIIFEEEIGHVKIGSHWFSYCCNERDVEPVETFIGLLNQYMKNGIGGPFETGARKQAGFSEYEIQQLLQLDRKRAG